MNTNLLNIVKQITAEYGEAVLADPARLKAFFSDLAKDEPKALRIAFGRCIEAGAYAALKGAPDAAERAERKTMIAQRLRDEHGLDPILCAEALDAAGKEPPRCAKCGAELREEWKACPYCGAASGGVPSEIISSGSDVYAAGYIWEEEVRKPVYWKNGQIITLSNELGWAYSIFVSGSDVYATGYLGLVYTDKKPVYWKNGRMITLSNKSGVAHSIFVSGSK